MRSLAVLLVFLVLSQQAFTDPTMTIDYEWSVSNYNPSTPEKELLVQYLVTNTSEQSSANNMISFTLPSGSSSGVYDFTAPTGWSGTIFQNETVFSGNGNYIAPSAQCIFELYSTSLSIQQRYATAMAEGIGYVIAANSVLVDVPGNLHTLAGDIDKDGVVDANDVCVMGANWLAEGAGNVADIYPDNQVNFLDFAILASDWAKQEPWYIP